MSYSIESIIKHMIRQNNHDINLAFPAVVVNVDKLKDGLIDVKPVVRYANPLTFEKSDYPTLYDIRVIYPSNKTSTISFPVNQGDYVEVSIQSVDIQRFIGGDGGIHDPDFLSYGNLSNAVAIVGFTPYQESCFNPNNYKNEFNNQDLNIVHNKNTNNEAIISINTEGDISLKSPTKVLVESPSVEINAETIEANNAVISTQGDVEIQGRSVNSFMKQYDIHAHVDAEGRPTSTPSV